jgi:pimeloyl-ACP methyl ester carboxylesterase
MSLYHHESFKSGTLPLLFIHADLGSQKQWRHAFETFKNTHTVISYDRRGHENSPQPSDQRFDYEAEVNDLLQLTDSLKLSTFVLVAHSGGAAIAFLFANKYPEKVKGLFLVDPAQSGMAFSHVVRSEMQKRIEELPVETTSFFYESIAGENPSVVSEVLSDVKKTDPETIIGTSRALSSFDPSTVDLKYKGPALVLEQTKNDGPYSIAYLGYYLQTHVDGLGHWIQMADPERVETELSDFLKFSEARFGNSRSLERRANSSDNYVR